MKSTTTLMNTRWHEARGSAKETWGKISGQDRTRLEGQIERLSAQSQEQLLRTEMQARQEVERAVQRGQQNIQELSAALVGITNQALGKAAKPKSSWVWIPALGGAALLAGLSLAVFTPKGPLHGVAQNQPWWGKLSVNKSWLKKR